MAPRTARSLPHALRCAPIALAALMLAPAPAAAQFEAPGPEIAAPAAVTAPPADHFDSTHLLARPEPAPPTELARLRESATSLGAPAAPPVSTGPDDAAPRWPWWMQTGLALGAVLALILAFKMIFVALARRTGGLAASFGPAGRAPSGLLEVLGRYPVARGQSFVLLRVDRRVLLIAQAGGEFRTLTEIIDPEDVASIIVKARDEEGASGAARFNQMLRDLERDPGVLDDVTPSPGPAHAIAAAPEGPLAALRRRISAAGVRA
ncbi:MAG: flagellar biosynthetic protein FliO [Planctomycetota bacterium]|nr:flagellar biosynthetic protein FliO [Planctomycetota bacterium]